MGKSGWTRLLLITVATVAMGGKCKPNDPPPTDNNGQPWTMTTVGEGAVLYREAALRSDADFTLRNVLKTILASEGLPTGNGAEEALLTTLLNSFTASSFVNPDSGLEMSVQVRGTEAGLDPAQLIDPGNQQNGMIPVGLFNRIDLMPTDAKDCGEHRIVFSTRDNRLLLIFEAKLPNKAGGTAADCAVVGQHWAKSAQIADPVARLAELKKLYFTGLQGFVPVVRAKNYGTGLGQVRSNTFRDGPWMLREWRIDPAPGALTFTVQPVATNPLAEFYQDNNNGTLNPGLPLQESERVAFQDKFANEYNAQLLATETTPGSLAGVSQTVWLLNTFGARIEARSNEFQSDSQSSADQPQVRAGPQFKTRLTAFQPGDPQHEVTTAQVLNRASAITCGGCHGAGKVGDVGKLAGAVVQWPGVLGGFRHIDTSANGTGQSNISPALGDAFLPFRRASLVKFLNDAGSFNPAGALVASEPDSLDAQFDAIVKGGDATALATSGDDFRRAVAARRAANQKVKGLFVENRRPH